MPDIVTYLVCGVRPKAKATATIKAASATGQKVTLTTIAHMSGGDVTTRETRTDGVWRVVMDPVDCVVHLTGPDDIPWLGVVLSLDGHVDASFVTYRGGKEAIGEARAVGTTGDPKDPWPPPGTPARLDTTWLKPALDVPLVMPRAGFS